MANQDTNALVLRAEYVRRVNRVIDYIEQHLEQELSLLTLADVAHFSRFHFHRIFHAMTGETLTRFVRRLRVEKAASMLNGNPQLSITEIALDCGFSSSATFARAFKGTFQMSATEWRTGAHRKIGKTNSKNRHLLSKTGKAHQLSGWQVDPITNNPSWRYEMSPSQSTDNPSTHPSNQARIEATIEVRQQPEYHVAYVRHVGPYAGQSALFASLFGKLRGWAGPRGLIQPDSTFLCVSHDDPNVTAEDKLRISVCLSVPEGTGTDGEIGTMRIPGGTFAVGNFEVAPHQVADAWQAVIGGWMPESGYQFDDRLCYERMLNNPREHLEGKLLLDICVPVKPL